MERNYIYRNRAHVRQLKGALVANGEYDMMIFVWPVASDSGTASGYARSCLITVSVIPSDDVFVAKTMLVHGKPTKESRAEMLDRVQEAAEFYQGDFVHQFPGFVKRR